METRPEFFFDLGGVIVDFSGFETCASVAR